MSWQALGWASKQRPGRASDKLILIALADRHNEESGVAYPSIAWLCEFSDLNRKTVISSLQRLEAANLIADSGQRVGKSKQIKAYKLAFETVPKKEQSPKRNSPDNSARQSQKRDTDTSREPDASTKHKARKRAAVRPDDIPEGLWADFLDLRKAKRAPLSESAFDTIKRNAATAGWPLKEAIEKMVARGWQGFEVEWVEKRSAATATTTDPEALNDYRKYQAGEISMAEFHRRQALRERKAA